MIKVITTVGTSLFTNYMRKEVQEFLGEQKINDFNIDTGYKAMIKEKDGRVRTSVKDAITKYWTRNIKISKDTEGDLKCESIEGLNTHCCAEVQTLLAITKKPEYEGKILEVHLLCTDTQLSKLASEIIRDSIFPDNIDAVVKVVEVYPIENLQVKNANEFENEGFNHLLKKVKGIKNFATGFNEQGEPINGFRDSDTKEVLLNISGGYKAIIPIMTIIGQLEDIPVVYLHEESNEVITIGNLPIDFDWHKVENYYDFLNVKDLDIHSDIDQYPEIRDQMISEKVITSSPYQKTIIGSLLKDFASEQLPTAFEVMGFYVELKLLEYYSKKDYMSKDNSTFSFPSMREKTELDNLMDSRKNSMTSKVNREVDLFIFKDSRDQKTDFINLRDEFITIECKPLRKLMDAMKQSNGQLLNFKRNPKEHCVVVYDEMDYKFDINYNMDRIKNSIKRCLSDSSNKAIINQVKINFETKGIELRLLFCPIVRNQVLKKGTPSRRKSNEYLDFISSTITIQEYTNF